MSHAREARQLLRAHRYGVLSTLSKKFDGHPFGSITPCLTDHDGSVLVFISALAEHTRNILHDARVSLITHDQNDPRIQTQGRVTLVGEATPIAGREPLTGRWLRYLPETEPLFELGDFSFFRIVPRAVRHVAGFGQARWIMSHFTVPPYPLISQENDLLEQVNAASLDTMRDCLGRRGLSAERMRMIGIDCDGFDIDADGRILRFDFDCHVTDAESALAELSRICTDRTS
ncbi:MAG: pyridoxamine 5'-phosphate oxidase family protein [Nitrosomonadales bacterium]|nr:pyridoxamine 5'-phosphate oxidase family protein [Nitrosomonadales bacterium]